MDNRRRRKWDYMLLLLLAAAVAVLFGFILRRSQLNVHVALEESSEVVDNPMIGFAGWAQNVEHCKDTGMVFIQLRWADWEPEEGVFDTEFLESKFHLQRWREEGKHGILRFVCDIPGREGHMDIPEWLREKTNDGLDYSSSSGKGYCPNYENPVFIEHHAKAIAALAEYFGRDDFLAYVQMGSLGYWGEWHCRDEDGVSHMPSAEIAWEYVMPYSDYFKNVQFLMRRSYEIAVESEIGVYNDVFGNESQTQRWLNWMKKGGSQHTQGQPLEIVPYPDGWKKSPVGGEMASSIPMEELLDDGLQTLLQQLEDSHATFIGPKHPDASISASAAEAVKRRLGYRYYVSRLSASYHFLRNTLTFELDWENTGSAPLYWDWPVTVCIFDSQGNPVYWEMLDLKLSQLCPGDVITTRIQMPYSDALRDGYSVGIRITDYEDDETLQLVMDTVTKDGYQIIYPAADPMDVINLA